MQDTSASVDNEHTRVPAGLVYKHPSKDEFPTEAGHWTKALEAIRCERSTNASIVLFGNEKYVAT